MNVTVPSFNQEKKISEQKTVILDKNTPDKNNGYGFAVVGQTPVRPYVCRKTSDTQKIQDALETLQVPGADKNSANIKQQRCF